MRDNPIDDLSPYLCLVIISFNGHKHLSQRLGGDDGVHELNSEPSAEYGSVAGHMLDGGEGAEEEA